MITPSRSRRTVLVVDDSELACEAVKHALTAAELEVVALNSPFGFIKAIRESTPALVMVDVGLGSMNGKKLVKLARSHTEHRCPIVLYSGREPWLLEADVAESSADGYITKATTGEKLVEAVRAWIDQGRTLGRF